MQLPKFQRIYELRVQADGIGSQIGDMAIIKPPFTVEFVITRQRGAAAKEANFKIYNLSEATRSKLFHDRYQYYDPETKIGEVLPNGCRNYPRAVEFYAGYESDGNSLSLCFAGNLWYGHSTRRGPDIITELECHDPAVYQYIQNSSKTLAKTTSKKDVIRALYGDLVGQSNAEKGYISNIFTGSATRGQVLFGNTLDLLKEITGDNFSFDNGRPMAYPIGEEISGMEVMELTPETGLLNVPVKSDSHITISLLFTPEIQMGQKVIVKAESEKVYNGPYMVYGIQHTGIVSGTHDAQSTTQVILYNGGLLRPAIPWVTKNGK